MIRKAVLIDCHLGFIINTITYLLTLWGEKKDKNRLEVKKGARIEHPHPVM